MSHALLVDDSVESLDALRAVVEREGFSVTCAGTLAEAYEAIEQKPPDVILLDLRLPDGDMPPWIPRLPRSASGSPTFSSSPSICSGSALSFIM